MNAVVDDELTQYGETSGDGSDDLYTKIVIYISIQICYQKEENVLHNTIKISVAIKATMATSVFVEYQFSWVSLFS